MTFATSPAMGEIAVSAAKLGAGEPKGEVYVRLLDEEAREGGVVGTVSRWRSPGWWVKVALALICLAAGAAVFIIWIMPLLLTKVVVPILNWERTTFSSKPILCLVLFFSIAIFPVLLIPSSPSIWVAGMTFGYVYGFLLIMLAAFFGMSLPFLIGSLFHHKLYKGLEKWPKQAAIVRLAGEGDWSHQFRAVVLLRISPFPYIIFNYAAVATNVKYGPYIFGSMVGVIPDMLIAIYSGILIRNLADATDGHAFMSLEQIVYDVIGFCIALSSTIAVTVYAKRALQTLQSEEDELL